MQKTLQKFTTCLWFDSNAEDAMKFYASVFETVKEGASANYGDAGQEVHGREKGSVMTVKLTIGEQELLGLNGGPMEELMTDKDKTRREKVFAAMMQMVKLDIADLEKAYRS